MYKSLVAVAVLSVSTFCTHATLAQGPAGGKDIAVDPLGQIAVIAGNDNVIRSTDGGLTWSPTPTPYACPERVLVRPNQPQTFIVAKHGEIAYSTTAGTGAWTVALQDSTLVPVRMAQSLLNPDIILLLRLPSDSTVPLWLSDNGGQTWNPNIWFHVRKTLFDVAMYPVVSDSGHRRKAYICGQGGYDSTVGYWDGLWFGYSADAFPYFDWIFTTAIWPVLQMDMKSLAIIPRPYPNDYIRLIVADAPLTRDTVFRSSSLAGPDRVPIFWQADSIRMIRVRKSDNWIFLATDRGVFRSTDEGTSWQQKSVGMPDTSVNAIALPDAGHKVFAVSPTAAYISDNDGESWQTIVAGIAPAPPILPSHFSMEQNYPNPFNPTTTLSFAVPTTSHVRITVHNTLGQLVATIVSQECDPGVYHVPFQATGLASGIYYYRLQANATTITRSMVHVK